MLEGKKIRLIAPRKDFIPKFVEWFNDPEVLQYLLMYRPLSPQQEEDWFKQALKDQNTIYFTIAEKLPYLESNKVLNEQRIIGNCSIRLDWKNRVGSLGIMIGEKSAWNKGYGTEAMKLLVEYGFRELNMNRIELEVFASNPRAKRCYEKVGFIEEGCKRQAQYINGKYIDEYFMSIIRNEWQKL